MNILFDEVRSRAHCIAAPTASARPSASDGKRTAVALPPLLRKRLIDRASRGDGGGSDVGSGLRLRIRTPRRGPPMVSAVPDHPGWSPTIPHGLQWCPATLKVR